METRQRLQVNSINHRNQLPLREFANVRCIPISSSISTTRHIQAQWIPAIPTISPTLNNINILLQRPHHSQQHLKSLQTIVQPISISPRAIHHQPSSSTTNNNTSCINSRRVTRQITTQIIMQISTNMANNNNSRSSSSRVGSRHF